MTMKFNRVKPGELIKAEVVNSIFDALEILDARSITLPGSDSAVTIINLIPAPPLQTGRDLQIRGANFGFSSGSTVVKFDEQQINSFKLGSNDTALLINVPFLSNLGTGKDVILSISNGSTTAVRVVRVVPTQQSQQGNVDILWNDVISPNPNPNPIINGSAVVIAYVIKSRALLPATFTIGTQCSDSAIQTSLQVLDATQTPLSTRQIDVAPNQQKGFFIRIPSVTVADGGSFSLTVSASSTGVAGSDTRSFTVGTTTPQPDPAIRLAFNALSALDPNTGNTDPTASYTAVDNKVHLKLNSIGRLNLVAQFDQIGTYDLSVASISPTSNWTVVLAGTPSQYVIDASDFSGGGAATRNPEIGIQAQTGASLAGQFQFTIQRQGAAQMRVVTFNLGLLP